MHVLVLEKIVGPNVVWVGRRQRRRTLTTRPRALDPLVLQLGALPQAMNALAVDRALAPNKRPGPSVAIARVRLGDGFELGIDFAQLVVELAARALDRGKPIVASRVGGIAEIVRDGDTGALAATPSQFATTVVSSSMLARVAAAHGARYAEQKIGLAQGTRTAPFGAWIAKRVDTPKGRASLEKWRTRTSDRPLLGASLVFVSAVTGFPPFAIVAVLAGVLLLALTAP